MKVLLYVVLIIAGTYALGAAIDYGMTRSEKNECLKLQEYALEFPNFYITEVEQKMCDALGIKIKN